MKRTQSDHLTDRDRAIGELAAALATLNQPQEVEAFLHDLCTPAELEALSDRWRVVGLLESGIPYREIHARTGVSVTTVGRVARFLETGRNGYKTALERLSNKQANAQDKNA